MRANADENARILSRLSVFVVGLYNVAASIEQFRLQQGRLFLSMYDSPGQLRHTNFPMQCQFS